MSETRKLDEQSFSDCFESLAHCVAQGFSRLIIARRQPFVFQLAPSPLDYVQVRPITRQVKEKQAALLPHIDSLFDNSRPMHPGVIYDHNSQAPKRKREALELLEDKLRADASSSRLNEGTVISRQQRETVYAFAW